MSAYDRWLEQGEPGAFIDEMGHAEMNSMEWAEHRGFAVSLHGTGCRDCAWDQGTLAVLARQQGHEILAAEVFFRAAHPAWIKYLDEQVRILQAPSIYQRLAAFDGTAGEYWQLVGPVAPQAITYSGAFTRSWGRRALEWAARWLHYYIR